jgi:DNA helicase-2/ATP-dependent DNA helicase PcrA
MSDIFEINPQQELAATYDQGDVLVLAGAGTGKTRTIIARTAHLLRLGVAPGRILMLTFTRRAAQEMVERLRRVMGRNNISVMAGTFHHFCLYTMRRMAGAFGIEGATVIDRDDQVQLMKLIRAEFRQKGEVFPKAGELVRLCSYARNTTQPMRDYLERFGDYETEMVERLCQVAQKYDQRKRQNNYLDYDDILFLFAKRISEDSGLRDHLRRAYDHILVDEMQDTNPLQWLILETLREPARLFCVGDDAQSIYAFRGADFRNVHAFTQRVPGAVVLRLEENYRSTQGILDLSNWLLDDSPLNYNKHLTAHRRTMSMPRLLNFNSDFEEALWVVNDLTERYEAGEPWHRHMIITRTGYGARALESFLVERRIPYRFVGGVSLLHAAHVKDLLCMVRAAASQHDELSWVRYLTLWPRIGDVTAAKWIKAMRQHAQVGDAIGELKRLAKGRKEIAGGIELIHDHWTSPAETIEAAAKFLSPLLKSRYERWEVRRRDFDLLSRLAQRHRSVLAFIETYTLDPISTTESQAIDEDDLVTLTTAHSAKGTEAQVCYLIRVEPGMYPHVRSLGDREQSEEERRILYVAMTRARDELVITRTLRHRGPVRMPYSAATASGLQEETYFLQSVPEELVESDLEGLDYGAFDDYDVIRPWRRD